MSTILPHMVWQCEFIMQVWNVLHAARWKYRTQKWPKIRHLGTTVQICRAISSQPRRISAIGKKFLNIDISSTYPHNMVNFGPLAAEIRWRVWDTPANFNGFRVLAALLRCTLVVGVSQTFRRWTEGATYIRQGGHHVGHWPTFLVINVTTVNNSCCPPYSTSLTHSSHFSRTMPGPWHYGKENTREPYRL